MKDQNEVNQRQKYFYESKKKNIATKMWSFFRNGVLNKTKKEIGVEKQIYDLHIKWFGDLSSKKVLDLGCYEGNSLSFYLAQNCKKYIGIDLSEKGIASLSKKLKSIPSASAVTADFLAAEFSEKDFDLIYAYGVLHHFKDVDNLIKNLNAKLNSKGEIISYDPLETSIPIKLIRRIYRPFQTDKDWEWPFSKEVYYKFENSFEVLDRRAVLGKAKWFFVLNFLPYSLEKKTAIAKKWHAEDWEKSGSSDSVMFDCMHLTMLLQKKNS